MKVLIPAELSHTGKDYYKEVGIDKCIAPIIKALNDAGIITIQSCCGHGKTDGRIDLLDGRILLIRSNAVAKCQDCGLPYEQFGLDVTLSVPDWKLIAPNDGLLCANCIAKRVAKFPTAIALRLRIDWL